MSGQSDDFIDEMMDWAEAKGPETYDFSDGQGCALAQFLKWKGFSGVRVGGWTFDHTTKGSYETVHIDADLADALSNGEDNFAALADRLQLVLMERATDAERELDQLENGV